MSMFAVKFLFLFGTCPGCDSYRSDLVAVGGCLAMCSFLFHTFLNVKIALLANLHIQYVTIAVLAPAKTTLLLPYLTGSHSGRGMY